MLNSEILYSSLSNRLPEIDWRIPYNLCDNYVMY